MKVLDFVQLGGPGWTRTIDLGLIRMEVGECPSRRSWNANISQMCLEGCRLTARRSAVSPGGSQAQRGSNSHPKPLWHGLHDHDPQRYERLCLHEALNHIESPEIGPHLAVAQQFCKPAQLATWLVESPASPTVMAVPIPWVCGRLPQARADGHIAGLAHALFETFPCVLEARNWAHASIQPPAPLKKVAPGVSCFPSNFPGCGPTRPPPPPRECRSAQCTSP